MSERLMSETKRPSIWNGQEIPEEFWARFDPPAKELPPEPAKVLPFPKK